MSSIASFSGIASGIQWRDMIDQIMLAEEARLLAPVQSRLAAQQSRSSAWSGFQSVVSKFRSAALSLQDGTAFDAVKVGDGTNPATGRKLFTATASSASAAGNYNVEVIDLAKADKLGSGEFASTSEALGLAAGTFFVNGRALGIDGTDSLNSVRDKINALNSGTDATGVSATILSVSSNSYRLVLTAQNTGSRGIELVDSANGVLKSGGLGILTASQSQNASPARSGWTDTQRFASKSATLETALGVTPPPAVTTVKIAGRAISVDFTKDTLLTIEAKIKAAGGSAEIKEEVVAGKTHYRLSVQGTVEADTGGTDPAASQRIAELMGFVRDGRASEISTGADAKLQIDGYTLTRRTNTIADAIEGVTLNLLATDSSLRTSSVTGTGLAIARDPRTIDAGTYAVELQTGSVTSNSSSTSSADLVVTADEGVAAGTYQVSFTTTTTKQATSSSTDLLVAPPPSTVTAGSYDVNITAAATVASVIGSGFDGSYNQAGLLSPDTITITDGAGKAATVNLSNGENLTTITTNLNNAFTANGVAMRAEVSGGKLQLVSTTAKGSSSTFTVTSSSSSVQSNLGIADGTYNGTDIQGTIGGYAATGSGTTLTANAGTAVGGLQVTYGPASTGIVGTVTVSDVATISGGTIGGEAATWDANTKTLTAANGTTAAGLAVQYNGPATSGAVGSVTVTSTTTTGITGATIGGTAAVWDSATSTIRGGAGTQFEGLELSYTGTVTSGRIGDFVVEGEIGVDLSIARDTDAVVKAIQSLATEYNAALKFVRQNTAPGGALASSGALRSAMSTLTNTLFADVVGVSGEYDRTTMVGLSLTKTGELEVDTAKLKEILSSSPNDVRALFSSKGTTSSNDLEYLLAGSTAQPGTYGVEVTALATRASFTTGGALAGAGGTYSGAHSLSIADAMSGQTVEIASLDGMTMTDIVNELNGLFETKKLRLTATEVGGQLKIEHLDYGSAASFTAGGTFDAAQLDFTAGTAVAGTDIQGRINGVTASGRGQTLTSAPAEGEAEASEGIAVRYTGTALGSVGDITYTLGVGGMFAQAAESLVRAGDGLVALQTSSISSSVDYLNRRIDDIEHRLELRRASLTRQFTAMEEALGRLQGQSSWLMSQIGGLASWDLGKQ